MPTLLEASGLLEADVPTTDAGVSSPAAPAAVAAAPAVGGRVRRRRLSLAAALCVVAAWVHLWLAPAAFSDWWPAGLFFLGVGLAQALLAVALLARLRPWVVLGGVAGNLVVVTTYVLSRTPYFPAGPHAGSPENVEALGTLTTAAEVTLLVVLVTCLSGRARRWAVNLLLLSGVGLWALRASEILM